jgi:8-oxo-dGTP diphosphatase
MSTVRVRVYGMWVNAHGEVLLSDERYQDTQFTKFPGGGLEPGETVPQALKREFMEECALEIRRYELLHVSESLVVSMFDGSQVVGIYYRVFIDDPLRKPIRTKAFDFDEGSDQSFRWVPVDQLLASDLTFEMDQSAWESIRTRLLSH